MSHFAEIDENNIVTAVIVAEQDFIDSGAVGDSSLWIQTSYNHNIRKQYAGIGYTYDKVNEVFVAPKPHASWTLDETSCLWKPPVAYPSDMDKTKLYSWDEDNTQWVER